MTESPYKFTIGLSVLHFLGPNLYSNIAAVLSEMVANAWDADAQKVDIDLNISKDEIIIKDDGDGMSLKDINEKYLHIGYLKRDTGHITKTPNGRHVMGRKGIGKLASFSFSSEMQIYSNNGKQKIGFKINWGGIESAIKNNEIYNPEPIDVDKIKLDRGTKVVLRELKQEKVNDTRLVRRKIARRFLIIDNHKEIQISVEGTPLSSKRDCPFYEKMEYVWYLGDESKRYLGLFPNLLREPNKLSDEIEIQGKTFKVHGWIGTVENPSHIREDGNNIVALFAHGKMIQEDLLGDFQEAQAYAQYIIGNIEVDFMDADDEPDIVTSDRQRVIQDDIRYLILKDFIREKIREVGRNWNLLRLEKRSASALEHPDVNIWYKDLNPTNKKKATRILGRIDKITDSNNIEREGLYKTAISQFNDLKSLSVSKLKSMEDNELLSLLSPPSLNSSNNQRNKAGTSPDNKNSTAKVEKESPPRTNVETNFREVNKILNKLQIEDSIKTVTLYDLEQAQKAYSGTAYKACAVMLGAILEGVMLGTIRRKDSIDKILSDVGNAPKVLHRFGLSHPNLERKILLGKISEELSFEDYKTIIQYLMPEIEKMKIEGIQVFRNTIHPWRAIQEPKIYGNIDANRISHLITSLLILLKHISDWKP